MDMEDSKSSWHIYCIRVPQRDELSVYLKEKGIGTGVHYKPVHLYNCYGNIPKLPRAERLFREILSLPMHLELKDEDVTKVIETMKMFFKERGVSYYVRR